MTTFQLEWRKTELFEFGHNVENILYTKTVKHFHE